MSELSSYPEKFFRRVSPERIPAELEASKLLWDADFVSDEPPSSKWLPMFAKMLLAIYRQIPEWEYLVDRVDRYAREIPAVIDDDSMAQLSLKGLADCMQTVLNRFPPRCPQMDSCELIDRVPGVSDRDDFISLSLDYEEALQGSSDQNLPVGSLAAEWMSQITRPSWSANYVLSALNYSFREHCRPALYERSDFARSVLHRQRNALHLQNAHSHLSAVFTHDELSQIRNALC